jgi:hypothetical protein
VFGDLVCHNFYSTRFRAADEPIPDMVVGQLDAEAAWNEAVAQYDVQRDGPVPST